MSEQEWGHEEEGIIPAQELAEFDAIVDRSFELVNEIAEIELKSIKPLKTELHQLDQRILATLKHHNKNNYRARLGMVSKAEKFSVKFPKNPDAKLELIGYMGQEQYIEMSNINYQTFNSWYKQKLDSATEEGDLDFKVAGVEEPTYVEYLQRRKG